MNQTRMLWMTMMSSLLALSVVLLMVPPGTTANDLLVVVLPLVAVVDVALSFVVGRVVPDKRAAMLVALAMCESSALLGIVLHLTTGWPYAWTLFALAAAGMLLHFPRED